MSDERKQISKSKEEGEVAKIATDLPTSSPMLDPFAAMGGRLRDLAAYVGGLSRLTWAFLRALRPPWAIGDVVEQCERIGIKSMPIAVLIMFFVGLVFALQFGETLATMGAVPYVGKVTSLSIIRELGPVFTSLVVGGRVGAGMAAEIGSMKVTEQIDAIRALGADPMKKLLMPRIIATTLMLPLVALFADIVGIFSGAVISNLQYDLSLTYYYKSVVTTIRPTDFAAGFFKPFFFGYGIALIGCYEGFQCGGGTEGVGKATTRAVVAISVMTVFFDFLLTKIFMLIPRI